MISDAALVVLLVVTVAVIVALAVIALEVPR